MLLLRRAALDDHSRRMTSAPPAVGADPLQVELLTQAERIRFITPKLRRLDDTPLDSLVVQTLPVLAVNFSDVTVRRPDTRTQVHVDRARDVAVDACDVTQADHLRQLDVAVDGGNTIDDAVPTTDSGVYLINRSLSRILQLSFVPVLVTNWLHRCGATAERVAPTPYLDAQLADFLPEGFIQLGAAHVAVHPLAVVAVEVDDVLIHETGEQGAHPDLVEQIVEQAVTFQFVGNGQFPREESVVNHRLVGVGVQLRPVVTVHVDTVEQQVVGVDREREDHRADLQAEGLLQCRRHLVLPPPARNHPIGVGNESHVPQRPRNIQSVTAGNCPALVTEPRDSRHDNGLLIDARNEKRDSTGLVLVLDELQEERLQVHGLGRYRHLDLDRLSTTTSLCGRRRALAEMLVDELTNTGCDSTRVGDGFLAHLDALSELQPGQGHQQFERIVVHRREERLHLRGEDGILASDNAEQVAKRVAVVLRSVGHSFLHVRRCLIPDWNQTNLRSTS